MQPLSGLDAAFLYLETPRTPMHVAGLSIFERTGDGARLEFATFRAHVAARVHLVRTYRERLVMVPLGLGKPYWIDDPDFDLDLHLHHVTLPSPGAWHDLRDLFAAVVSRPLNRARPLWEMTFVEGLEAVDGVPPGSCALIAKVHHAAIDGLSGGAMLGVLLDPTPDVADAHPPAAWKPAQPPGPVRVLARSGLDFLRWPVKAFDLLSATVRSAARLPFVPHVEGADVHPWLYTSPHTRLNVPVSADRVWDCLSIPLARVKAVKALVPGSTVNDVLLALSAGALRRYLAEKGDLPQQPLIAMMPISTRPAAASTAMGNQVSAILVDLATDEADPLLRLHRIHAGVRQNKALHQAVEAQALVDSSQLIPFSLATIAARLYTNSQVTRAINPIFNCVITNIPGPQQPVYLRGARMVANMGMTPVYDGVGLLITIFSYDGVLTISATSCREIMPDTERFIAYLEMSLTELEAGLTTGLET